MRLLLDKHALYWHTDGDSKLSTDAQAAIDRMLISQVLVEKMATVSVDSAFDSYGVTRI